MVCYSPLQAYRARFPSAKGTRSIVFNKVDGYADLPISLACGQCVGCRLERSRQWAVRCLHESKMHEDNCFITLTYEDGQLPPGNSLVLKHYQDFMKRLRKKYGSGIRFFHCGEYGDMSGRPHYHAILFNFDFSDKKFYKDTRNGDKLYTSDSLESLWPFGFSIIGEVTFESAAYVARYVMKKRTGEGAAGYYQSIDPETGEVFQRIPEYITMSRRPGIGSTFVGAYMADIFPSDFCVINGVKARPPRYYDGLFELESAEGFRALKAQRVRNAKKHSDNNTPHRLKVREEVTRRKLERLKREGVE